MIYPRAPLRVSDYTILVEAGPAGPWVLAHGYSGAIDKVDQASFAWIQRGLSGPPPSPEASTRLLQRGHITRRTPEEEKRAVVKAIESYHQRLRAGRKVTATVILSYDCNFRCTYCTQRDVQLKGQEHLDQGMSDEVMDSAFRFFDAHAVDDITLFGGEPFMPGNEHRVRRFASMVRERGHRISCVSNGSHWRDYEDVIVPEVVSHIQVTIDGPPEVHDRRRVGLETRETFHTILDNVGWALERGVHVSARINTDRSNVDDLALLTSMFVERKFYDHAFNSYISPVQENGFAGREPLFGYREMYERMLDAHTRACHTPGPGEVLFDRGFLPSLRHDILHALEHGEALPYRVSFCGAYTTMNVLDPFGRIFACWDFADDPDNVIGVFHPELRYEAPKLERWRGRDQSVLLKDCLSCRYVLLHGSGCQAESFRRTGSYEERDCQNFDFQFDLAVKSAVDALDVPHRAIVTEPYERRRRALPVIA
ncbi:MAG: 4Fe-4S cluster-binding domain-containing protein [Byssovorax sp.]